MKPASEWASEFLSKHVLNTRASGEFERFIAEVQRDAIKDAVERVAKGLYKKDGFLLAIYSDVNESWNKDRENIRERYKQEAKSLMDLK